MQCGLDRGMELELEQRWWWWLPFSLVGLSVVRSAILNSLDFRLFVDCEHNLTLTSITQLRELHPNVNHSG